MKLTGNLKKQVESAPTREEKREIIKKAGMLLSDDELEQVSGGGLKRIPRDCPYNPECYIEYGDLYCFACELYVE